MHRRDHVPYSCYSPVAHERRTVPLTKGDRAPYAPPATVLDVVDRFRNFTMATPFDVDVIITAGVPESLAPRTLQSLRLLELVDDGGHPTPAFVRLRESASGDFEGLLGDHLRDVYQDIFAFVDPGTDPLERIEDAFRGFYPTGQRSRMVTLFLGMCERAGIVTDDSPSRVTTRNPVSTQKRSGLTARPRPTASAMPRGTDDEVPPAVLGLVSQLPVAGSVLSADRLESFIEVLRATLNFVYHVVDEQPAGGPEVEAGDGTNPVDDGPGRQIAIEGYL